MSRLTENHEHEKWCLRGLNWFELNEGRLSVKSIQLIYGALCKLRDYENTGMTPEEIISLNEFENSNGENLQKEIAKHRWNPVEERLPADSRYILLSFENFSLPLVGRYEDGAFYIGDCDEGDTCVANELFVNAWMELPKAYRPDKGGNAE
ncbi:MAG: hypothetical protein KH828_07770 [Clostridiales bacterium]|nr:hypothetical protein [Clostridiales bacterium]